LDRKALFCCLTAVLLLASCSFKHPIVVASKNFTEQVLLGEIIAQHLENRLHHPVERKLNLGGTLLAHQALLSKDIDVYPEYTGTAFTNVLKLSDVTDPGVVLDRVRTEYAANFKIDWLDPLGFENTFAMTVRSSDAQARHLETLSDAASDTEGFSLGAGYEFTSRPDGFATLNKTYPIHWTASPLSMDLGLLYTALLKNKVSMVASSSTDGMLSRADFTVLKDDKQAFPPYQACIVARSAMLAADPGLRKILSELSGKFTGQSMREMNYAVDIDHKQIREVAKDFLQRAGLQ
jgi:osmoprotectant transport system substrate-binding protein